ncbi:hypothetical protein OHT61_01765 [Streptomyces sp. NBC_00178]|uniref:hypothetical protein n=1 Tax=Streptomyces sp. NBC_00178 TaxID=2975672 RepID=UPI002E2D334D|nr:hypothetical protein [Streptomyces sp. NBC_00178]
MHAKNALVMAAALCAGAAAVTGCGGEGAVEGAFGGKSADRIAADAVRATQSAQSLRVRGHSRQSGGDEVAVDFRVDRRGHCTGSLAGRDARADILRAGRDLYVKGDRAFWENALQGRPGTDRIVRELRGKWMRSQDGRSGAQGMCDKQSFLAALDSDTSERTGMTRGPVTTIGGRRALTLEKKRLGGEKVTMYVATDGEPYILRTVTEGGTEPGEAVFSEYGAKVEAREPAAGDIVDPALLEEG